MARGVNKATILGNIGSKDVHQNKSGKIVRLSVATNEKWKDKETGDLQELTTWHSVVFFGKLAEIVDDYTDKGHQIYVEGKMRLNKWVDDNNVERYKTEIIANEAQLLSQPSSSGPSKPPVDSYDKNSVPKTKYDNEFSDDIPF